MTRSVNSPEIKALRAQLTALGVKFHHLHGQEKLQSLLDQALSGEISAEAPESAPETLRAVPETQDVVSPISPPEAQKTASRAPKLKGKGYLTRKEFEEMKRADAKRNANRLVRCRITCMNPNKKGWTGEFMDIGSAKIGSFKKFIPYNLDEPYHVPYIIYEYLKDRKCVVRTTQRTNDGKEINKNTLINEFSIEVLPPLTKEELKDLAQRQAMAGGVS